MDHLTFDFYHLRTLARLVNRGIIQISINDLIFNKITLKPTFAEPAINFPLSNKLLREGLVDPTRLITHTPSLDQLKDTIASIIKGDKPIVKAVCLPNG